MTQAALIAKERKPFFYLESKAAKDAPFSDNPSGLYCPACRDCGLSHCSSPEWCGNMRRMRLRKRQ